MCLRLSNLLKEPIGKAALCDGQKIAKGGSQCPAATRPSNSHPSYSPGWANNDHRLGPSCCPPASHRPDCPTFPGCCPDISCAILSHIERPNPKSPLAKLLTPPATVHPTRSYDSNGPGQIQALWKRSHHPHPSCQWPATTSPVKHLGFQTCWHVQKHGKGIETADVWCIIYHVCVCETSDWTNVKFLCRQGDTAFHWNCVQRSYQRNGISSLASWTYLQSDYVICIFADMAWG